MTASLDNHGPLSPPPAFTAPVEADSQAKLMRDMPLIHTKPLWAQMNVLVPPKPVAKAAVHKWAYKDVRPQLIRAGQLVSEHEAERRVLMLINPQMGKSGPLGTSLTADAPYTTDTLYAGIQLVMPGETAPAHRHTAFAVRFIIEGHGGFTAVNGKRIKMARGDFILTPTWNWHDHGNDGVAAPMIWLDGLDLPQFQHFPVHFAQHYSSSRYPAEDAPSSTIHFPWSSMMARLEQGEGEHVVERYTSREPGHEGEEVSLRLGAQCERLDASCQSRLRQETTSAVYHVISGDGVSMIGDKEVAWTKGDTFAIPSWHPYQHKATTSTFLFRFDDRPMITALGFYRTYEDESFVIPPEAADV